MRLRVSCDLLKITMHGSMGFSVGVLRITFLRSSKTGEGKRKAFSIGDRGISLSAM